MPHIGFIKLEPEIEAPKKRTCIVHAKKSKKPIVHKECTKYLKYWNDMADTYPLPKIRIPVDGSETKSYVTSLQFFWEFQNGVLFTKSKSFKFSEEYLVNTNISKLSKSGYSATDIFYFLNVVAKRLKSEPNIPASFSSFLYSQFTVTAKRYGGGSSRFLEICSSVLEDDRFSIELDREINKKLTDEEYKILLHILCDLYHQIRKDDENLDVVPDFELSTLLSGLKILKNLYMQFLPRLRKSRAVREREINPTFYWFCSVYSELIEIPDWPDMPIALLFNRRKQFLGKFIDRMEAML